MTDGQMRMWLKECYRIAAYSPDTSTQVGAMLVNQLNTPLLQTRSFNGPPKGWTLQPEDLLRPRKYLLIEHAERRALYKAAKLGIQTEGCILVSTWAGCAECCRSIIECGITVLVRHTIVSDETCGRWLDTITLGDELLKVAGVKTVNIRGPILKAPPILRGERLFNPSKLLI